MKLNSNFFQGSYWLPGLIIGSLLFLGLTAYFGYLITTTSRADQDNLKLVTELQANTGNVLFLSRKVISGDTTAIKPLRDTVEIMESAVAKLLEADRFTKDRLPTQFETMTSLWRSIEDNEKILTDAKAAIDRLNELQLAIKTASINTESLTLQSVETLTSRSTRDANLQMSIIYQQALLVNQMADNLGKFIAEEEPNSEGFDNFRANLGAFDQNHKDLMNGNRANGVEPILIASVRNNLQQISDYLGSTRNAQQAILEASERKLLASNAYLRLNSNFSDLNTSFDRMSREMRSFSADRFPKVIHLVFTGIIFFIFVVGLVLYQRALSRQEVEKEQEEGQRSQAAILRLLDELVDLADGDLTISATVSEDFTGAIADSINFTIDQLRQLVSRINSTAVEVSQAAQGTQQTALHLAEASDHQAQEIAGASAAINEMAVTIDQVSANASESALVAGKSVSIAHNGAKLVQNTIHGMDTIREQIQDTSKRIKRLGESSQEIGDIVSLINDIADQTNILALNAAIQASMAGDAGRGFAVVADEVQRLAERSAAATKQIETIVKTIQTDTNEAVISMEQTTSEVVNGARLAQDAGVALEEIEGVSANLAELIQNISNAARQQASSAGHISNTMNVIQEITSQTSAGTAATAQSIGDLANMALELRESVAGFTLPPEMVADLEEQHAKVMSSASENALPVLDNEVADLSPAKSRVVKREELMEHLEINENDLDKSSDFFDLLTGDGEAEDDDLLSEFDVDLSEIDFPGDDQKSVG